MKTRCCRSTPRCDTCPARRAAAARKRREQGETAALVSEILMGEAPRPLPGGVAAALDELDRLAGRRAAVALPARASA